jgi:hypothetical protein
VLFAKAPSPTEILNDLDGQVVNFFTVLRDRPGELARALQRTPYARAEYEQLAASYDDPNLDELERARRWFVRVNQSISHLAGRGRPSGWAEGQGGGRLGVGGHHPVVGPIGRDGFVDQARADQLQGLAFPGLVLAAVLGQLAGAEAEAEGAEAAAGVDGGQLPVIADQHHLGPGLLSVVEETGELAAAEHAGLVHYQHGPLVELLAAVVEVAQEPVAGGHLLEPLGLQGDGRDPGGGGGEGPVAVQLPGMAGYPEGECLACPCLAHHNGDAGAALADVADHPGLVLASGRMGLEGGPDDAMPDHRRLLAGAAGGRSDELLLDAEEFGGGPAAFFQRPVGHHGHRLLGQEPVGQALQVGPGGAGKLAAEGNEDFLAGEGGRGRGQPGRAGQVLEHLGHRPLGHDQVLLFGPAGHLPDQGVRIVAALGRLCPPAAVQGVRCLLLLGFAGGLHCPLDQPGCPLPPLGFQSLDLQVDLIGALGEQPDQVLGHAL